MISSRGTLIRVSSSSTSASALAPRTVNLEIPLSTVNMSSSKMIGDSFGRKHNWCQGLAGASGACAAAQTCHSWTNSPYVWSAPSRSEGDTPLAAKQSISTRDDSPTRSILRRLQLLVSRADSNAAAEQQGTTVKCCVRVKVLGGDES